MVSVKIHLTIQTGFLVHILFFSPMYIVRAKRLLLNCIGYTFLSPTNFEVDPNIAEFDWNKKSQNVWF